jgi:hypothetical protein
MSLYWVEHYRHPSNKIVRGTLRTDGFVSLHAGYGGGLAVTHPLTFEGNRLVLNFSTSAVGSVRVEVLQADGRPVPGLSGEASPAFFGDNIAGECRWSSDARIGDLAGQAVRLKLHLKDADLFAIQFKL